MNTEWEKALSSITNAEIKAARKANLAVDQGVLMQELARQKYDEMQKNKPLLKRLRPNKKQRIFFADKLMDTANYAIAVLVLGQLVNKEVDALLLVLGLALYLWLLSVAFNMTKGVRK